MSRLPEEMYFALTVGQSVSKSMHTARYITYT